ncbi:hypothetical protein Y032_0233g3069 [Ancylostoma ceylanicum]|nr:hypothetical protein Y032_0233g3069 [Ancylostoma ceylanicum]
MLYEFKRNHPAAETAHNLALVAFAFGSQSPSERALSFARSTAWLPMTKRSLPMLITWGIVDGWDGGNLGFDCQDEDYLLRRHAQYLL